MVEMIEFLVGRRRGRGKERKGEGRGKREMEKVECKRQEGRRIKKFTCDFCADLHCDGGKGLVCR